jgi:bleomycin hydrolase
MYILFAQVDRIIFICLKINNLKTFIMKTKTFIFAILLFFPALIYCQNHKTKSLHGSWMGKVTAQGISLRALLRFEAANDKIKGFFDSPDQGIKGIPLDKVWTVHDSIFVDASSTFGPGPLIFKGLIMPGDSVIDGVWGGSLSLRLRPTNFVFALKTNLNPKIEGYKIIKLIESTPIKDQQATGACWSYEATSFIETEAIRLGKSPVILSPMFYVTPTYIDKAEKYIRTHGTSYFSEGDMGYNVMSAYKKFGAIPEKIYSGKKDSTDIHNHGEMNNALLEKVKDYVKSGRGNITTEGYRKDIEDILANTMGKAPDTFIFRQKKFTPKSFAEEMVGINPDDYIEITSYNHHPFYSKSILEIEDNWNNSYYLNLPINDFINVVDNALLHNYSVSWGGDIHEGFHDGFAVLSDSVKNITQQMRQAAYDNYTTQDDHGLHIIGIAENEKGERYYIAKNSSDVMNCGGYLYMSREYLLLKTISVMVHKAAIPKEIKRKLTSVL